MDKDRRGRAPKRYVKWTKEQKELVIRYYRLGYNFSRIADMVKRSEKSCRNLVYLLPKHDESRKGKWKIEEVTRLKQGIEKYGKKWFPVSEYVATRTPMQCKNMYYNILGRTTQNTEPEDSLEDLQDYDNYSEPKLEENPIMEQQTRRLNMMLSDQHMNNGNTAGDSGFITANSNEAVNVNVNINMSGSRNGNAMVNGDGDNSRHNGGNIDNNRHHHHHHHHHHNNNDDDDDDDNSNNNNNSNKSSNDIGNDSNTNNMNSITDNMNININGATHEHDLVNGLGNPNNNIDVNSIPNLSQLTNTGSNTIQPDDNNLHDASTLAHDLGSIPNEFNEDVNSLATAPNTLPNNEVMLSPSDDIDSNSLIPNQLSMPPQ